MVRLATNGFFRFYRRCFGMKVDRQCHRCTDIKCPLWLSKIRTPFGPFDHFFHWLHGLSRLLIGGLPRTETEHPTINHRWSVRRARILHFLQHCNKHPIAAAGSSVLVWQKLGRIGRSDKTVILDWLTVAATGDIWDVFYIQRRRPCLWCHNTEDLNVTTMECRYNTMQ